MKTAEYVCIKGSPYTVVPIKAEDRSIRRAYRLYKEDTCTCYDVIVKATGPECDCGDWTFRRVNTGVHCKHIFACITLGFISANEWERGPVR